MNFRGYSKGGLFLMALCLAPGVWAEKALPLDEALASRIEWLQSQESP